MSKHFCVIQKIVCPQSCSRLLAGTFPPTLPPFPGDSAKPSHSPNYPPFCRNLCTPFLISLCQWPIPRTSFYLGLPVAILDLDSGIRFLILFQYNLSSVILNLVSDSLQRPILSFNSSTCEYLQTSRRSQPSSFCSYLCVSCIQVEILSVWDATPHVVISG